MEIRACDFDLDGITALYAAVGWSNYTERYGILAEAYRNSLCVLGAYEGEKLIGIIRAVGDGYTILFIQDILVLPEYQRKGIGSRLMQALLKRYRNVYQIVLLTDDTEETKAFYGSLGFTPAAELGCISFVRM